jgi:hypothetical protein
MIRTCLTDAQWEKMEPHCHGKPSDPGRTGYHLWHAICSQGGRRWKCIKSDLV